VIIQGVDCILRVFVAGHLDKRESARTSGRHVAYDVVPTNNSIRTLKTAGDTVGRCFGARRHGIAKRIASIETAKSEMCVYAGVRLPATVQEGQGTDETTRRAARNGSVSPRPAGWRSRAQL
jgi:hypothetical protein